MNEDDLSRTDLLLLIAYQDMLDRDAAEDLIVETALTDRVRSQLPSHD